MTVGIPSRRSLPPDFGIIRSRTASGTNRPDRRSARSSARNMSSPRSVVMYLAVTPSTPAVRAPRLLRTRSHAARKKLGSVTSPNRSSNRRSPSSTAQRCSFVWIPSTRGHASTATGPGATIFTGDLPAFQSFHRDPAAALRHAPGFPRLGLIRRLRPAPPLPADDVPARPNGRDAPERFPRSPQNRSTGSAPSYTPAAIHEYAAVLPRGHPDRRIDTTRASQQPFSLPPGCAASRPRSARLEPMDALRGVRTLVPHVRLSVLLAGPRPSGSTGQSRRCQGRLPPSPASPGSGCPQLPPVAATARRWWSLTSTRFSSASWRTRTCIQNFAPSVVLEPHPEHVALTVDPDAERQIAGFALHRPAVTDLQHERVKEQHRVDVLQRPLLPGTDVVHHRIGHPADQVPADLDAVELAQMRARYPASTAHASRARGSSRRTPQTAAGACAQSSAQTNRRDPAAPESRPARAR